MEELAILVLNDNNADICPLTEAVIKGVAAALKGASFRSAALYLGELRLRRIEAKLHFADWTRRLFTMCEKSVARGLGPPKKAEDRGQVHRTRHPQDARVAIRLEFVGRGIPLAAAGN